MVGRRVGIIGAGAVGATAAYSLAFTGTCHEIILYDIYPEVAIGKAIDISQSTNYSPRGTVVRGVAKPEEVKDCDVVVITAGVPRKKDMTRMQLLDINAKIVKEVAQNIKKYSPNAIVLVVSNPLDVMTYVALKVLGWERNRVLGMGGALDRARMAYQIYQKIGFGMSQVRPMVIGNHGEDMVPYPEITSIAGVPLPQLLSEEDMEEIIQKTKEGGAEIVKYLKTSAFYAPGRAVSVMVEAILSDEEKVIPSCVYLDGEYGHKDVTIGVPCAIGAQGVNKIIEMELEPKIKEKFDKAVKSVKNGIKMLEDSGFFESL